MAGTSTQHKIFQNSYFFNKATSAIEAPFSALKFSEKLLFWKQLFFSENQYYAATTFQESCFIKVTNFAKELLFRNILFQRYLFVPTLPFQRYFSCLLCRVEHFSEHPALNCFFFTVAHTTLPSLTIVYLKSFASKLISQGNMNKNINRKI